MHGALLPKVPQVSVLDWALLSLLQSVRSEFVDKIVLQWQDKLQEILERDQVASISAERRRFMHNLYCALELVAFDGEASAREFDPDYGTWTRVKVEDLLAKLKAEGPRLFNSYYYITINSYGDSGEYFFFPVVPGRSSLPRGAAGDEAQGLEEYLKTLGLPFEFRRTHRIAEYSGMLLPGKVGLTPQICLLAASDTELRRPEAVPLFLGDFAILGKAEDAVQRHLSALVAPLIEQKGKECLGAFLLTSSVPDAFARALLEPSFRPGERLGKVVTDWSRAPLRHLHAKARQESRDATIHVQWPRFSAAQVSQASLKAAAEDWLHTLGEDGAAAILYSDGATEATLCAINHDSLVMSLRATMCPGPLLAPSAYTVPHGTDEKGYIAAVSNSRFKSLLEQLAALDSLTAPRPIDTIPLFKDRLIEFGRLIEPTTDSHSIVIQTVSNDRICAAAIYARAADSDAREVEGHLKNIARQVESDAKAQGSPLPGERSRVFPTLEALHHRTEHDCYNVPPQASDRAGASYNQISELLTRDNVLGVLLFEKADIFVADICDGWPLALSQAIYNPASYWVFEQICQLAAMTEFPVERVKAGTDYFNPAPFVASLPDSRPDVTVCWSRYNELNQKYASALNYLGVPVSDWRAPKESARLVVQGSSGQKLATFYRGYLKDLLKDAGKVDAIERAIRTVHGTESEITIDGASLVGEGPRAQSIELRFDYRMNDNADSVSTIWRRTKTARLEFAAINVRKLTATGAQRATTGSAEEKKSEIWYPSRGWQSAHLTEPFAAALDAAEHAVEEKEALIYKSTRFAISHESDLLLRSLSDLIEKVDGHACSTNPDDAVTALGSLRDSSRLARIERDLFSFQLLQIAGEVPDAFDSIGLATSDPRADIFTLARIGARQGVTLASSILLNDGIQVHRGSWERALLDLTDRALPTDAFAMLRINNKELHPRRRALNILTITRILSHLYKHCTIDLARALPRQPDTWIEANLELQEWQTFASRFSITFSDQQIVTNNICDVRKKRATMFKRDGTFSVLTQYVEDQETWGDTLSGAVDWGIIDRDQVPPVFRITLRLPFGFWRRL